VLAPSRSQRLFITTIFFILVFSVPCPDTYLSFKGLAISVGVYIMDNMQDGENNFKDTNSRALGIALKDKTTPISYNKVSKLITALYMVTDIMDREEPLRNKLRTLGTNIISDIHSTPSNALLKISEIMSFLDIAGVVNLVSEMNLGILRKEFFELKKAIEESIETPKSQYTELSLSDLFKSDFSLPSASFVTEPKENVSRPTPTRIGVQKGSTLMKALSGFKMSDKKVMSNRTNSKPNVDFEVLKRQRREEIIAIIKTSLNGATITDIKSKATGSLATCGEKTLQRELIGMLKDNLLKKTGEKRWSRYYLV
jgi:hypothetical protein